MKREDIIASVKQQMPERRWTHTEGVMETAVILAKRYGEDPAKAELAAILHDVCKYWRVDEQARVIRENGLPQDLLGYDKELWHAHAGAWVAEHQYGVKDEAVLDAIRYHTSGRERMTKLDKIVCLADYMEPGRDFPGVHNIREIAEHSLEKALIAGFDGTIRFLLEKGKRIYPLTLFARNGLIEELERQEEHYDTNRH
ncbi:bis(5'-nucleosyl)-tetraphosphatase (symmetrical) YqeK [Paenibacillus validus]|uniref:bis(5'-nucleosyl)-tetraphosphatase (symmetrical) n=1 Tax=Paenibacillus validus TaxID=44253 RepID=A0A7X3CQT1_9BACL|nr:MULTISPECIES: bis(5'-nucleosyl)-tetraphosphatase (symmetrical) YqeK [Paenibacillus]MED4604087.1 bis(5'-nucleosyl)-tetraphosphatase (symmetrical) YqeK [Paenibacillus validus]MED4607806.1 bis(5'-nucleosyl)-tetraphosphatase (symmetrical) YqeK [Paenibacillus validus]MUG69517.1 HD domain-containing protein [Paenibacillus validus]